MKDVFNRKWIIEQSLEVLPNYDYGVLTLRGLFYQLVARGMTNSQRHYKRVGAAMTAARRNGLVSFDAFSDHDREMLGRTMGYTTEVESAVDHAKDQIEAWFNYYTKNRWENQPYHPEIWIEKKALQGVFRPITMEYDVALAACKGYPSLTFLNEAAQRFQEVIDKGAIPLILYFGDYDATGEDIPRSIAANLKEDFGINIEMARIGLHLEQVLQLNLPPAPTKTSDSRAKNWEGIGQVELDAVNPNTIQQWARDAIEDYFDQDLYDELKEQEVEERQQYKRQLQEHFNRQ
ncbi:MAG: hypothetical protein ACRBFS_07970 [Aureispira sp.]